MLKRHCDLLSKSELLAKKGKKRETPDCFKAQQVGLCITAADT